jgi:hypothetical protein
VLYEYSLDQIIEHAKRIVEVAYGCQPGERRWLESSPPNSYKESRWRVQISVLEGSPPKGYVLACSESAVLAIDCSGQVLKRLHPDILGETGIWGLCHRLHEPRERRNNRDYQPTA